MIQTPQYFEYKDVNDNRIVIEEFISIELISTDTRDSIQKDHNNIYPFAIVDIPRDYRMLEYNMYFAFEYNAKKTHYTALLDIRPMQVYSKEFFPYTVLVDFKEHIPISTNIKCRQPNDEEYTKFNKQLPSNISERKLITIITIDQQDFFLGYYNYNIAHSYSFTVFNKVD